MAGLLEGGERRGYSKALGDGAAWVIRACGEGRLVQRPALPEGVVASLGSFGEVGDGHGVEGCKRRLLALLGEGVSSACGGGAIGSMNQPYLEGQFGGRGAAIYGGNGECRS